jgi:hypothetical protein
MSRTVHVGYEVGPTLGPEESPWSYLWEQDPKVRECFHTRWETCLLAADGLHRVRVEEVVRCVECHAPRCGHTTDEDPCIEVRHHDGPHVPASCIPAWRDDPIARHFGWVKGIPACTERTCTHGWGIAAEETPQ